MGLKKSNYLYEKLDVVIPKAYALVTSLEVNGDEASAVISLGASRKDVLNKNYIKSYPIRFAHDRFKNPYEEAYDYAKSIRELVLPDGSRVDGPFIDWDNDYVINTTEGIKYSSGENEIEDARVILNSPDYNAAVYVDQPGTILVINGGIYDASANAEVNSAPAVYARDGGKVIINDGEFIGGEGCSCIYSKNSAVVEINGGTFRCSGQPDDQGRYWVLNLGDNTNASIVVKGGTFIGFNPADNLSEGEGTNFVAEGYEVISLTVDGVTEYRVVKS